MAVDIKEIVGKEAIKGLEKTNTELKQSNDLLKEQITLLDKLNKEYSETKNNVQLKEKLNKQEKINTSIQKNQKTLTQKNTALQKERIRVEQQKKKILAQTLSLEEKSTKTLIKGQERLKIARKKAREEAQRELGVTKKQGGLFRSVTKSILTAGAAMVSFNAVVNIAGKIMKAVFLGTQNNIDFFRVKLAGLSGQFNVLKDRAATFGETIVKQMNEGDGKTKKFLKTFARANPLFVLIEAQLKLTKKVFKGTFDEMERVGKASEELEKRLIALEKATADINLRNAVRRRDIQELIFLTRQETVSFDKRMEALKLANTLETEILKTQQDIQRERVAVLLAEETITDEQIAQIANKGVALEQVGLTLSTEAERQEVITEITKLYEIQTLSLAKQRELQNRVNELTNKRLAAEKAIKAARLEETKIDETVLEKKKEIGEQGLIINQEQLDIRKEQLLKTLRFLEDEEQKSADKRKAIAQQLVSSLQEIGGIAFQFEQQKLNAELEATRVNYDAQIQAAEGNSEKQEALSRELAQKQWEIQVELTKSAQNQALFDIAINTATGVSKALATEGPVGIITGALVAAAGLAQAALVTSQPLPVAPQFEKGTLSSPDTFIAGDGSGSKTRELMVTKDGQMMLTPNHATLYQGMEGTQVIPNAQTEQILSAVNLANAGAIDNKTLENKLDNLGEIFKKSQSKMIVNNYKASNNDFNQRIVTRFKS